MFKLMNDKIKMYVVVMATEYYFFFNKREDLLTFQFVKIKEISFKEL